MYCLFIIRTFVAYNKADTYDYIIVAIIGFGGNVKNISFKCNVVARV